MKKTLCFMLALLVVCSLLCSCNDNIKSKNSDENGTENAEQNKSDDTPKSESKETEYVKPTTFAKAFSNISEKRMNFYDLLSYSLLSVNENANLLKDIKVAIAGETTFVHVSACGSVEYESVVKTQLEGEGCTGITCEKSESGVYTISGTKASYEEFEYAVSYDSYTDLMNLSYKENGVELEKMSAKRIDGAFIVQYYEKGANYVRYRFNDDKTAIMYVTADDGWHDDFDFPNGFEPLNYDMMFEVTEDKFHCIYYGVEYMYYLVTEAPSINLDGNDGKSEEITENDSETEEETEEEAKEDTDEENV